MWIVIENIKKHKKREYLSMGTITYNYICILP